MLVKPEPDILHAPLRSNKIWIESISRGKRKVWTLYLWVRMSSLNLCVLSPSHQSLLKHNLIYQPRKLKSSINSSFYLWLVLIKFKQIKLKAIKFSSMQKQAAASLHFFLSGSFFPLWNSHRPIFLFWFSFKVDEIFRARRNCSETRWFWGRATLGRIALVELCCCPSSGLVWDGC